MDTAAESSSPSARQLRAGTGRLTFTRVGPRTVLAAARAESPLKFLSPRNHGTGAWVYVTNFGGGLVDGDCVDVEASVEAGALALLTTQASTKVYRSPRGCSQRLRSTVDTQALLACIPDPVVCFAGARFEQSTKVTLARDASLVYVDCITSGRAARGERWAFDSVQSRIEVEREGELIALDAIRLDASILSIPAMMGRFNAIATVLLLGADTRLRAAASKLIEQRGVPQANAPLVVATSPLRDEGCLVRIGGETVEAVMTNVRERLGWLTAVLGDDPFARKW